MSEEQHEHPKIDLPELLSMRGPAYVIAREAMRKRERADELFREVNQLIADATELERGARALAAERTMA